MYGLIMIRQNINEQIYAVLTKMPNLKLNNLFSSESEIAKAVLCESG